MIVTIDVRLRVRSSIVFGQSKPAPRRAKRLGFNAELALKRSLNRAPLSGSGLIVSGDDHGGPHDRSSQQLCFSSFGAWTQPQTGANRLLRTQAWLLRAFRRAGRADARTAFPRGATIGDAHAGVLDLDEHMHSRCARPRAQLGEIPMECRDPTPAALPPDVCAPCRCAQFRSWADIPPMLFRR